MRNLKYEPIYKTERLTDTENRLVIVKGEGAGQGVEWEGGLADVSYYIDIGWTTRSNCIVEGTLFNILR